MGLGCSGIGTFREDRIPLEIVNNENHNCSDKLDKIRPVIRYIEEKLLNNYTPDKDISVDENLMKFRGRLSSTFKFIE